MHYSLKAEKSAIKSPPVNRTGGLSAVSSETGVIACRNRHLFAIALGFLQLSIASLAPLRVFGVTSLCKILLCCRREYKLLVALATDEHTGLKTLDH